MPISVQQTTMSVPQMRKLLGLGKTESYWLVHKQLFDVILLNGQMRIVLSSFENWYAGQTRYRKVEGPEPGQILRQNALSIAEVAEMLGICNDSVYCLLKKESIATIMVPKSRPLIEKRS